MKEEDEKNCACINNEPFSGEKRGNFLHEVKKKANLIHTYFSGVPKSEIREAPFNHPELPHVLLLSVPVLAVCTFCLYRRHKRKQLSRNRASTSQCNRDESNPQLLSNSSTDVQLSRLRGGQNLVTEFNPNYEFGGSTCTLSDLKEISREKLTLVK